jgi:hypothetical protein
MKPGASHAPSVRTGWRPNLPATAAALLVVLGGACGTDRGGLGDPTNPPISGGGRDTRDPDPDPQPDPDPDPGKPDASPTDAMVMPKDTMSVPADAKPGRDSHPNCNFGEHEARKASPEVLLLYDRSAGMRRTVMGTMQTRWVEMMAGVDDAVRKTQTGLQWGLKLFPSTTMCEVADGIDVQVGALNYSAVVTAMRGTEPVAGPEGSPLHTAIRKAHFALAQRPTINPRFLVLASDANVSCLPGLPAEMEAVKNVETAAGQGIRTFVLGTAAIGTRQHTLLDQLATAGKEPISGPTKYYAVQNKADMLAALERISERLTSCVWTVPAQAPAPDFVIMEVNGMRVPRDVNQREGWNWAMGANRQVIHVYGQACERLRANPTSSVVMVYGCPGISP